MSECVLVMSFPVLMSIFHHLLLDGLPMKAINGLMSYICELVVSVIWPSLNKHGVRINLDVWCPPLCCVIGQLSLWSTMC